MKGICGKKGIKARRMGMAFRKATKMKIATGKLVSWFVSPLSGKRGLEFGSFQD